MKSEPSGDDLPKAREAVCQSAEDAPGTWLEVEQPPEILGLADLAARHYVSDGETFSLLRRDVVARMRAGTVSWEILQTDRFPTVTGSISAASPDFLFVLGGLEDDGSRDAANSGELLDLSTGQWTRAEPPPEVIVDSSPSGLVWSGEEFVAWGTYQLTENEGEAAFLSHAVFLNPVSQAWRTIEGPVPPRTYRPDELDVPLFEHFSVAWSERGLVAWGIMPDGSDPVGFVLDAETEIWQQLPSEGAPSRRRSHRLVPGADGFFLVGGDYPDSWDGPIPLGGLWHFSWATERWREIDLPDYVSPHRAVWLDGKLYIFGGCDSDAAFDYVENSWSLLPPLDLPSSGHVFVSGSRLIQADIEAHHDAIQQVYVYDTAEVNQ